MLATGLNVLVALSGIFAVNGALLMNSIVMARPENIIPCSVSC